jgi:predicted aldo/keto reductase-like oxidoreductase
MNDKILSNICLGAMRFADRETAVTVLHRAIDEGINYVDTSPGYCRKSEAENSESWIGSALKAEDYRERILVSSKSTPGNGGLGLGEEFVKASGFGVRTKEQSKEMIHQSLSRMGLKKLDWYQLWTTHTQEQLDEALKPGGWLEGVLEARDEGLFSHLGITTHADSETVISFLETGYFEMVTLPYNILDTSRQKAIQYAAENGIIAVAMNPLSGGLLTGHSDVIEQEFADLGVERVEDLALGFILSQPDIHPIVGISSVEQLELDLRIASKPRWTENVRIDVLSRFNKLKSSSNKACTGCNYCKPCPEGIDIGAVLHYYNLYKVFGLRVPAKDRFKRAYRNNKAFKIENCVECGQCESRCPNSLPIRRMLKEQQRVML